MSTRRRMQGGFVDMKTRPRGPNGRGLCRRCETEVPKGRSSFCSKECVHEWRLRSDPGYLRAQAFKRDRGVCAVCGADTEKIGRVLKHAALHYAKDQGTLTGAYYRFNRDAAEVLKAIGLGNCAPTHRSGHRWQADHIVPVIEGGGECGLENIRTLCTPCHRAVTKELHGRLKRRRSPQAELFIRKELQ